MLYLHEHEILRARIVHAVRDPLGDIHGMASPYIYLVAVEGHHSFAFDDEPVLRAACMRLVADPLPGPHHDRLDLETLVLSEDGV